MGMDLEGRLYQKRMAEACFIYLGFVLFYEIRVSCNLGWFETSCVAKDDLNSWASCFHLPRRDYRLVLLYLAQFVTAQAGLRLIVLCLP